MVNTTQQVGGSLGTALLNTIFTTTAATYLATHAGTGELAKANAAIHGYNVAFTASAILLGVGALLSFLFIRKPAEVKQDSTDGEFADAPIPVAVH